jgi:hypothetical protein
MRVVIECIMTFKMHIPFFIEKLMLNAKTAAEKLLKAIEKSGPRDKFASMAYDPVARARTDLAETGGHLDHLAWRLEHWIECDIRGSVNV